MLSAGLEGNSSIALLWYSVHCDLPLAPWVMKGLINESIRVSVCCSLCVSAMQSSPDVPSLRARRGKGCHCWQAWWMGGTPRHDKDECDSPRPAKGGRRWTTKGRSRDALPPRLAGRILHRQGLKVEENRRLTCGERRMEMEKKDYQIVSLCDDSPSFSAPVTTFLER